MHFTRNELINMGSAILIQMKSGHLPEDCCHYQELDKLYTKIIKEIEECGKRINIINEAKDIIQAKGRNNHLCNRHD